MKISMVAIMKKINLRYELAKQTAIEAGKIALDYYQKRNLLSYELKEGDGQNLVSIADKNVEDFIRQSIRKEFSDDSIFGEEAGLSVANSGYTWVIDPIDGTSAFLFGLHSWCVSIALLDNEQNTLLGIIYDPVHDELYHSIRGEGAFMNNTKLAINPVKSLNEGLFGVGISTRLQPKYLIPFLDSLLSHGGMFVRNGSAALMLAYVAAGKLIGYYEPHLNSWDCLAGILLINEAGGKTNSFFEPENALIKGNYVLASSPFIYEQLNEFI